MKPIPKEDIQSLERDILFQVLDFFEQYHITYFTSGGTTLGAVRHEGFIPWDDDIDLYIPRADYNRMLQLATNRTIGKNIRIYKPGDKNYIYPFAKACNINTRLNEQNVRHREQDIGIFIDLFPLDKFYDDPVRRNLLILHSKWLNSLLASASDQVNLSRKGSLRRLAKDTLRTLQKPLAKAIGISRLTRRIDALGRHTAKADCHLVGDLVWCNGGRDFYPAEHFAAGVPAPLRGAPFKTPSATTLIYKNSTATICSCRRRISGSCMALPAGIWMKQEKPNDQNCCYPLLFWQAAGELFPVCGKLSAQCYHRFFAVYGRHTNPPAGEYAPAPHHLCGAATPRGRVL